MTAGLRERTFADFPVGTSVVTRARTITEADLVSFSGLTWDFYPLHTDEEYSRARRFHTRIAHGALVYSYSMGIMPIDFFGDAVVAFTGIDSLRHRAPVGIGDTIHVEARVTEARPASQGDSGVVRIHYVTKNQRDEVVMEMTGVFLMRRTPAEPLPPTESST